MTGPNVEFLDEQPGGPTAGAPATDGSPTLTGLDWLAVAGWAAAAALGVVASLTNVFTYRLDFSAVHSHGGYTATGRSLDPGLRNDRGTDYAMILAVCVVAFALVGLAVFRDGRAGHGTRLGRSATPLGIGAVAMLFGVLATIALGLVSSFASYRTLANTLDAQQAHAVRLAIGPCLWFGIAALLVGIGALVLTILRLPGRAAGPDQQHGLPGGGPAPACGTPQQVPPRSDETDV